MNRKEFARYLERDRHCLHCGSTGDDLVPQHRANRGHGGYKAGNAPSNIIVLCSLYNGLIESNAILAAEARENGWKLQRHEDPGQVPVYDVVNEAYWLLDNNYAHTYAPAHKRPVEAI